MCGRRARREPSKAQPSWRALTLANAPLAASTTPPIRADAWSRAVNVMRTSFTGGFAVGISLIAIVIVWAMFTMDESGSSKKKVGGLVFGSGVMLLAAQFLNWTFEMTF